MINTLNTPRNNNRQGSVDGSYGNLMVTLLSFFTLIIIKLDFHDVFRQQFLVIRIAKKPS